jgi:CBS domain-containing protein
MKLYYDIGKVEIPKTPIEEFMVTKPETVEAKATVSKAAHLMARERFNQLPVLDVGDRLGGMVFDIDILSVLIRS